jgi:hypothetical protein
VARAHAPQLLLLGSPSDHRQITSPSPFLDERAALAHEHRADCDEVRRSDGGRPATPLSSV